MSKADEDLLRQAKITRVTLVSEREMMLYSDDQVFVITAVNNQGPTFDVRVVDTPPRLVVDNGRAKPRPKAEVINLADYRNKPTDSN